MFCSGATWIICVASTVRSFDPTRVFRLCSIVCLKRTLFWYLVFLIVPRHVRMLNFFVSFIRLFSPDSWLCDSMFRCYTNETRSQIARVVVSSRAPCACTAGPEGGSRRNGSIFYNILQCRFLMFTCAANAISVYVVLFCFTFSCNKLNPGC